MFRHARRSVSVLLVLSALLAFLPAGCAAVPAATTARTTASSTATTSSMPTQSANAASTTASASDPAPTTSGTPAGSTAGTGSTALPSASSSVKPTPAATLAPTTTPATSAPAACTISVVCRTAVTYGNKIVPLDGVILAPVIVPLQAGDTVLSVLVRAITAANPKLRGGNIRVIGGAYVSGIGNDAMADMLYEKDCGPESGWLYYIGGTYVSDGASRRIVQAGEIIEWKYTCASGRDLS